MICSCDLTSAGGNADDRHGPAKRESFFLIVVAAILGNQRARTVW